jgi:hypothetical protein
MDEMNKNKMDDMALDMVAGGVEIDPNSLPTYRPVKNPSDPFGFKEAEKEKRKREIEEAKADEELRKELMEMAQKGFKDYNDYLNPF